MSEPLKTTLTPVQSAALHLAVMVSDPDTWNLSARDIDAITTVLRALPSVQSGPIASDDDDVTALEQWADEAANQLWDGTPNIGTRLNRLHLLRRVARRLGETADYDVTAADDSATDPDVQALLALAVQMEIVAENMRGKSHHANLLRRVARRLTTDITKADEDLRAVVAMADGWKEHMPGSAAVLQRVARRLAEDEKTTTDSGRWMLIRIRETNPPEIMSGDEQEVRQLYTLASAQWTDTFIVREVVGPNVAGSTEANAVALRRLQQSVVVPPASLQADTRRLDQVEAIKPAIYQPTENDEVWKVVDVSDSYRTYSGPTLRGTIDVMLAAMETKK